MDIRFEGMSELIDQLQKAEHNVDAARDEAVNKGADIMQKATENAAPVLTGNLKRNIEKSDPQNGEVEVYVDNQGNAYYGYMLEYGTSKMAAQPFMGPAFNQSKGKMQQAMADSIRKRLGWMS